MLLILSVLWKFKIPFLLKHTLLFINIFPRKCEMLLILLTNHLQKFNLAGKSWGGSAWTIWKWYEYRKCSGRVVFTVEWDTWIFGYYVWFGSFSTMSRICSFIFTGTSCCEERLFKTGRILPVPRPLYYDRQLSLSPIPSSWLSMAVTLLSNMLLL